MTSTELMCGTMPFNVSYTPSSQWAAYVKPMWTSLTVIFFVYWAVVVFAFIWFRKRDNRLLRRRRLPLFFSSLTLVVILISGPIREVVGRENFSCDAYLWLLQMSFALGVVPLIVETFLAISTHLFQREWHLARSNRKRRFASRSLDSTNSTADELSPEERLAVNAFASQRHLSAKYHAFTRALHVFSQASPHRHRHHHENHENHHQAKLEDSNKVTNNGTNKDANNGNDPSRRVTFATTGFSADVDVDQNPDDVTYSPNSTTGRKRPPRDGRDGTARSSFISAAGFVDLTSWAVLKSNETGVVLGLVLLAPFIFAVIAEEFSSPLYAHGCIGCEASNNMVMVYLIITVCMALLECLALYTLSKFPDPLGISQAITRAAVSCAVLVIISLILTFVDPGNIIETGAFHIGDFFVLLAGSALVWFMMAEPVLEVYFGGDFGLLNRLVSKVDCRLGSKDYNVIVVPPLQDILSNPTLREEFEAWIASEFAQESLLCLDAIAAWRDRFEVSPPEYIQRRARAIYDNFINPSGALAVNIPATIITRLEAKFKSEEPVEREVFDDARDDLTHLITTNSLRRYWVAKVKQERKTGTPGFVFSRTSTFILGGGGGGGGSASPSPRTSEVGIVRRLSKQ